MIDKEDRQWQNIVRRENEKSPIKIFQLNTITYGTSSALFLAIRMINQLAEDEKSLYPLASAIVARDFYVDDKLTGANKSSLYRKAIQ